MPMPKPRQPATLERMKTYIVRCIAGGFVIGGCLENAFGAPLTKREANAMARFENERSARRREQRLPGCFEYYVDSFERATP